VHFRAKLGDTLDIAIFGLGVFGGLRRTEIAG